MKVENRSIQYLIFIVVGIALYANIVGAPFYLDDYNSIVDNHNLRLDSLSLPNIVNVVQNSPHPSRFVSYLSFALTYYFFGYDVVAFHLFNICIHVLTGIFLFEFMKITVQLCNKKNIFGNPTWIALLGAMLWLVHPIQTQAVTYVVQRMTSLASLFYILSILLYVRGRLTIKAREKWFCYTGCFVSGGLSLGTKEIGVTLPFFILLYEYFFVEDLNFSNFLRKNKVVILATLLACSLCIVLFAADVWHIVVARYETRNFSMAERVLTESRVLFFYLGLLLFPYPARLSLEHDFTASTSLFAPWTTLLSVALVLLSVLLAVVWVKKYRLYSFIFIWFIGNLLLESTILPLELVFEHRLYLPSMLFFLPVPLVLFRFLADTRAATFSLLLCLVLSCWTVQRNSAWANPVLLYASHIDNAPNSPRAFHNFGRYYMKNKQPADAVPYLTRAVALDPHLYLAHKDLGDALYDLRKYPLALEHYLIALNAYADDPVLNYKIGFAYKMVGDNRQSIHYFENVLKFSPEHVDTHNFLAKLYVESANFEQAAHHFSIIDNINGHTDFGTLVNLANCHAQLAEYDKALYFYDLALKIEPGNMNVIRNRELVKQSRDKVFSVE